MVTLTFEFDDDEVAAEFGASVGIDGLDGHARVFYSRPHPKIRGAWSVVGLRGAARLVKSERTTWNADRERFVRGVLDEEFADVGYPESAVRRILEAWEKDVGDAFGRGMEMGRTASAVCHTTA